MNHDTLVAVFTSRPKDNRLREARCPKCRSTIGGLYEVENRRYLFARPGSGENTAHLAARLRGWLRLGHSENYAAALAAAEATRSPVRRYGQLVDVTVFDRLHTYGFNVPAVCGRCHESGRIIVSPDWTVTVAIGNSSWPRPRR